MIYDTVGDLLNSEAECLVNGVNCEGVMGKGIAFQFKNKFPVNYQCYVEACRTGECSVGHVFFFEEGGKLIANFPSKNLWRQPSRISYIKAGLVSLVTGLQERGIASVAVPPLGCGNGGLFWADVKKMIVDAFSPTDINVYLYEPVRTKTDSEVPSPKMTVEHLVLLKLSDNLKKGSLDMIHLEAMAFIMNVYYGKQFFKFDEKPLSSHQISLLSKDIRAFKKSNGVDNKGAEAIIYNRLICERVNRILDNLDSPIRNATSFVNNIEDYRMLKAAAIVIGIVNEKQRISQEELIQLFFSSAESSDIRDFSENDIGELIEYLKKKKVIESDFFGIKLVGL